MVNQAITPINLAKIIFAACKEIGGEIYFGTDLLIQTLRGSDTYQVEFFNLDQLQCFGMLEMVKVKPLQEGIEWLISEGYLQKIAGAKPLIKMAPGALKRIENADLSKLNELANAVRVWNENLSESTQPSIE